MNPMVMSSLWSCLRYKISLWD